jgi:hypothetical protein
LFWVFAFKILNVFYRLQILNNLGACRLHSLLSRAGVTVLSVSSPRQAKGLSVGFPLQSLARKFMKISKKSTIDLYPFTDIFYA